MNSEDDCGNLQVNKSDDQNMSAPVQFKEEGFDIFSILQINTKDLVKFNNSCDILQNGELKYFNQNEDQQFPQFTEEINLNQVSRPEDIQIQLPYCSIQNNQQHNHKFQHQLNKNTKPAGQNIKYFSKEFDQNQSSFNPIRDEFKAKIKRQQRRKIYDKVKNFYSNIGPYIVKHLCSRGAQSSVLQRLKSNKSFNLSNIIEIFQQKCLQEQVNEMFISKSLKRQYQNSKVNKKITIKHFSELRKLELRFICIANQSRKGDRPGK